MILLGTVEPTPWDIARLRQRVETVPGVSQDLLAMGFWQPLSIFSAFVLDGEDLSRMLAGVEGLHSDNRPVIEYLTPRAGYVDTTAINDAGVQTLQTKALPAIAGFDEARDFDSRAKYLLGFGYASIGRIDPAIRMMEQSIEAPNAEAKFFVGLGNQYRVKGWNGKAIAVYRPRARARSRRRRGLAAARRAPAGAGRRRRRREDAPRGARRCAKDDAGARAAGRPAPARDRTRPPRRCR